MEERLARLETHFEHILRYLADLKAGLEKLTGRVDRLEAKFGDKFEKMEAKFDDKFDKMEAKHDGKLDRLEAKMDDRFEKMDARLTRIVYWALGLYIALATTLLGVMARGFHWL